MPVAATQGMDPASAVADVVGGTTAAKVPDAYLGRCAESESRSDVAGSRSVSRWVIAESRTFCREHVRRGFVFFVDDGGARS